MTDRGRRTIGRLLGAAAAVPVVAYFVFFFSFALDLPFGDDYPVLAFAVNFTNPEWPKKTQIFFSQHNEHRIVTLRAVVLAFHYLSLKIDWVAIAFLGNLGILGIVLLLWKHAGRAGDLPPPRRILWFLPVVFFLFQPQHHQLTLWAMCAFTNVGVLLFALLSFFLLTHRDSVPGNTLPFLAAVGFALLAAYTNGNGVFAIVIGAFVLLAERTYRRLFIWLGTGAFAVGFYFTGYVRNPEHPAFLPFLKDQVWDAAAYFLSVLGSFADFGVYRPVASIAGGATLLAALFFLAVKRIDRKDPFLFSAIFFVLLSLAALTWTRASFGVAQSTTSRYKFVSALAAVLIYLALLRVGKNGRNVAAVGLAVSMSFGAVSFLVNVPRGRDNRTVRLVNVLDWNRGKAVLPYANREHTEAILRLAVQRKIYEPPRAWNITRPKFPFGGVIGKVPAGGDIGASEVVVSGWALDNAGPPRIVVRRSPLPSDRPETGNRAGLIYVGRVKCRKGTAPDVSRIYYGFPGRDRMLWEFRYFPDDFGRGPEPPTLSFFARDRAGHETLLGTHSVRRSERAAR